MTMRVIFSLWLIALASTAQVGVPAAAPATMPGPEDLRALFVKQELSEHTAPLAAVEERWGIRVERLKVSGGGNLIDFRFRVLDAEKAGELFRRDIRPYLVDQASGARLAVPSSPKVGQLRTTHPPVAGRVYFIVFGNSGGVRQGARVSVVAGAFKLEDMIVR